MPIAAELTGWWIGYAIGAPIVLVVAGLLLAIIATVRRIADVADNATDSLRDTRDRTEVLWQLEATSGVAREIVHGAGQARRALGG